MHSLKSFMQGRVILSLGYLSMPGECFSILQEPHPHGHRMNYLYCDPTCYVTFSFFSLVFLLYLCILHILIFLSSLSSSFPYCLSFHLVYFLHSTYYNITSSSLFAVYIPIVCSWISLLLRVCGQNLSQIG